MAYVVAARELAECCGAPKPAPQKETEEGRGQSDTTSGPSGGEKTPCIVRPLFDIKAIILPRQARDKCSENSKQEHTVYLCRKMRWSSQPRYRSVRQAVVSLVTIKSDHLPRQALEKSQQ
eukprot:COSAG06_NODE_25017_length_647_cov_1.253650_1_plen_119_part_10